MNYRTVFDIADAGYRSWTAPAFGLIFVAFGIFLIVNRKNLRGQWSPRANGTFAFCFFSFAVLWTFGTFFVTYRDYSSLSSTQSSGVAHVVEGRVHDFVPMPVTGHAMERFCVAANCFEYSDYVVTGGFNNTSSHGGPIRSNLQARVTHIGNVITKLEVAQ